MFDWLKKCIKDAQEIDKALKNECNISEQNISVCKYESSTGDCSLIQQLKEKQSIKKTIENDIKLYEKYDLSIVQYVRKFLVSLEEHGFSMDYHYNLLDKSAVDYMFNNFYGVEKLEEALRDVSINDIDKMYSELKALKQRTIILNEKNAALKAINDDITDIKMKLGID